jgi:DNA-binding NarL/FixJ family response regulator
MNKLSSPLTPREQEVYELVITGKCNKDISAQLGITTRTVRFHLSNIFVKTSVSSRLELICAMINLSGNVHRCNSTIIDP